MVDYYSIIHTIRDVDTNTIVQEVINSTTDLELAKELFHSECNRIINCAGYDFVNVSVLNAHNESIMSDEKDLPNVEAVEAEPIE